MVLIIGLHLTPRGFRVRRDKRPHALKRRVTDSPDLYQIVNVVVWPTCNDLRCKRGADSRRRFQLCLCCCVDIDDERPFRGASGEDSYQIPSVANQPHSSASDSYHRSGGDQPLLVAV